jgi:glutamate-1-semialdehyde aminotransferase
MKKQNSGPDLWRKAKKIIPGGTQLLSKRSEQFLPDLWPSYYKKASGVNIWDLDGNRYIDMSIMGVGACPLGYADKDVNAAVKRAVTSGSMSTLNCPEEVELAECLIDLHPWAEMVRYTRCGGEAMTVAVRIARAATGRDRIAFCGYHGWHDWYLSANLADDKNLDGHLLPGLEPSGVPRCLKGTASPFHYNSPDELEDINDSSGEQLAAIVMEPIRDSEPEDRFLQTIKKVAKQTGAVLIVDEVSAGFRLTTGGAHLLYQIKPDIAVFAKAMSNGYPMAAIIGKTDIMGSAQDTFISSTYWTERIGPVAALATIAKYKKCNVPEHLVRIGRDVQHIWKSAATDAGLEIEVGGIPPLSHFSFSGKAALAAQTLFTQLMLERGYLASRSFYPSYAHTDEHVTGYTSNVREVFKVIAEATRDGTIRNLLLGPEAHSGFTRLT